MAPDPGQLDSLMVTVIGGGVAGVFAVLVAVVNRVGTRRSKDQDRLGLFVETIQKDNEDLRAELAEQRKEIHQLEELRRADFEKAVAKLFPELPPPKETS